MNILRTRHVSITVAPSFFVLALLLALFMQAGVLESMVIAALVFLTFLVHEAGHVFVSLLCKRTSQTHITATGGKTEILGFLLPVWKKIFVYLGGVLFSYGSLLILGSMLEQEHASEFIKGCFFFFYGCTFCWFLLNILPLYPFDCGEAIVDIAQIYFGRKGEKYAACLCGFFAVLAALVVMANGMYLGVIVCLYSLGTCYGVFKHTRFAQQELSEEKMYLHHLCQQWGKENSEKIIDSLKLLSTNSLEQPIRQEARASLAGFLIEEQRAKEAYDFLMSSPEDLSLSGLEQLQLAAYITSHWQESLEAGKRIFIEEKTLPVASLCALASGRLLRTVEAVEWIISAHNLGLESIEEFVEANDFAGIQDEPMFQELKHLVVQNARKV